MPLTRLQSVRDEVEALFARRDKNAPNYSLAGDDLVVYAKLCVEEASLLASLRSEN